MQQVRRRLTRVPDAPATDGPVVTSAVRMARWTIAGGATRADAVHFAARYYNVPCAIIDTRLASQQTTERRPAR